MDKNKRAHAARSHRMKQSQDEAPRRQEKVPVLVLGAAFFTHQLRQGCLESRHASAMNHLVRQAVPDPSEPEYRPLQQCWVRPWPLLLQLAIVLVNGPPRAVAMFDRWGWVEEGRQICMSLARYAAKYQAKHRNISTDTAVQDYDPEKLGTW